MFNAPVAMVRGKNFENFPKLSVSGCNPRQMLHIQVACKDGVCNILNKPAIVITPLGNGHVTHSTATVILTSGNRGISVF